MKLRAIQKLGNSSQISLSEPRLAREVPEAASVLESLYGTRQRSACPACGKTLAEYEEDGLLGCPICYYALLDVSKRL